jgi:kanamycin kinase
MRRSLPVVLVPDTVSELAEGAVISPVWENEVGGLTFRLDDQSGDVRYVKWAPAGTPEIDLTAEAERLAWARRWITVPSVIDQGADEVGAWLVTAAVPGRSAVDPGWLAEPETAAAAIGRGLRHLHETLPVGDCPYNWRVEHRLDRARDRLDVGQHLLDRFDPASLPEVANPQVLLSDPPSIDRLVVCHGDACAPNTLLHDDGTFAAHVDLDSLGVADRWADLAVAAWSTEWNYGPGYEQIVYDSYGIDPDPERITFYRLIWDLT